MGIFVASTTISDDYIIGILGAVLIGGATAIKFLWSKVISLSEARTALQDKLSKAQAQSKMAKLCDVPGCKVAAFLSEDSIDEKPKQ